MRVIVADASPLNYLVLIGEIDVLTFLYGIVVVPSPVMVELSDPAAPASVQRWASAPPQWVEVRQEQKAPTDPELAHLGHGERAAIAIAQREAGTLLLIDELKGRSIARQRGIETTGTLGILSAAGSKQLLDLPSAIVKLAATNFRASPVLVRGILEDWRRRRG
jgi:predicted nucleic acid-binding protein